MNTKLFLVAVVVATLVQPIRAVHSQTTPAASKQGVVAVFSLDGPIKEIPQDDELSSLFGSAVAESLKDLVARLEQAGEDPAVKAVALLIDGPSVGTAQIEELRKAIDKIKAGGKPVHVHADVLTTSQYVLLSGATEISMVPTGYMFITGLYGEQLYIRDLLDKIGVKPDYFTRGDYKSAAEMFMRSGPSPAAERMHNWLFDSLYDNCVRLIAEGRGASRDDVRGWIDHGVFTAERAKQRGIIDAVWHRQEFEAQLRRAYGDDVQLNKRYGKEGQPKIDLSSPFGILQFYARILSPPRQASSKKDTVAVVYLEGMILSGEADPSPFGTSGLAYSTTIRKALDKVAADDSIDAVVLRINSPGGSAVASEIILDATRRVKAKKPFVVSMGDVAGSGGYYVACGAETIFADPSTITGSIGVVAGKFATTGMWQKLGINFTPIKRGKNAALLSSYDVFSAHERAAMEGYMDEVYAVFKQHVVAIRGDRLSKKIDELAGGRVFTGRQALELGLIDRLGGLEDAIALAAEEAGLEDYNVRVVPRPKSMFDMLLSGLTDDESDDQRLRLALTRLAARGHTLPQLALPYLEGLDPQRLAAVLEALAQLELLEAERVSLTMPLLHFDDAPLRAGR